MRFDDRLSTVLGLSAEAPRDRAVQWRQLVELVARGAGASDPVLVERALDRIEALSSEVPDAVRIAAAKAIAGPGIPLPLLTKFLDAVETAAPLLAAAELDETAWAELRSRASPSVQELIEALRPRSSDKRAPEAAIVEPPAMQTVAHPSPIEDQEAELPGLFHWECGPTGEVDWVEGASRAALIGRSLADDFEQRFSARLPFNDQPLVVAIEGDMAGEWRWSGTPAFFPDTGRFAGYRGSARRGEVFEETSVPIAGQQNLVLQGDRLRELIHELRTPLNAIIGFGEIIEGQILGPAHRAYRDRAGEIVRQSRRLLAAVDDLDLAAKLQSGRSDDKDGSPLPDLLAEVAERLAPTLAESGIGLSVARSGTTFRTSLQRDLATRLLQRFVEAVLGATTRGEQLFLGLERRDGRVAATLSRPRALQRATEQELLNAAIEIPGERGLGTSFGLRLVRGLAIVAGGGLEVGAEKFSLFLPATRG